MVKVKLSARGGGGGGIEVMNNNRINKRRIKSMNKNMNNSLNQTNNVCVPGEVEAASDDHLSEYEVGFSLCSDSIAIIQYTSGYTGFPMGVRVPHKAILNRLVWQWHTFPYQPEEVRRCYNICLFFFF